MRFIFGLAALIMLSAPAIAAEETLSFGRFGTVTIYRGDAEPNQVVLFISGDGGWNKGVVDMARSLAGLGSLVVGIDIISYLKRAAAVDDTCTYIAGDLESLSQFVQQKYKFREYRRPVLVGYSSGATLVYATLVQAPEGTFLGGISLGFCPDLRTSKPLCKGQGLAWTNDPKLGAVYTPAPRLATPWIALHGAIDQVCDAAETRAFMEKVGDAELVELPKVGHGFSVQRNWLPQFKDAFASIVKRARTQETPNATAISNLPLVEVPAKGGEGDALAILVTGDGGWAGLDRDIGAALANHGIPVVGLDSLSYFWTARTPEGAAADLDRIIGHYLASWRKRKVILVGYSFGADVLPFMTRRLSHGQQANIAKVVLLGPSDTADFEFHFASWLGQSSQNALPVPPEIEALQGLSVTCLFGTEEEDSICRKLTGQNITKLETKGGHHFGGDVATIVKAIAGR